MRTIYTIFFFIIGGLLSFAQNFSLKGRIVDPNNKPIAFATVYVDGTQVATQTNEHGDYTLEGIGTGRKTIKVSFVGFSTESKAIDINKAGSKVNFVLSPTANELEDIVVYGRSNKNQRKVQDLTRIPLPIQDQVQSISIVSDAVIKEQGALSITDAARNVAGVTQFASYGGVSESMSIRGFRGTPVLKNGVALDTDFRTAAGIVDMQGIESVQVIKGSASIGQGIGNGLGSAGGVINVITKTPNFVNKREVSFRAGSYGQIRPTVDVEQILDKNETASFRFNGSYERNDGFRIHTGSDKYYLNPSFTYKPDDKTTITAELDYLESNAVADRGTVNLSPDTMENLYKMPHNKFLGFEGDYYDSRILTYGIRAERALSDNLSIRFSSFNSVVKTDQRGVGLSKKNKSGTTVDELKFINRSISKSNSKDESAVMQLDFVGKDIITGFAKHTFQVGFDYRQTRVTSTAFTTYRDGLAMGKNDFVDTIDVLGNISNEFPNDITFQQSGVTEALTPTIGFMAQDYVELGQYIRALVGIRYSRINGNQVENASVERWNPIVGLIVSPTNNINVFGSYTTTSSLRQSNYKLEDGGFAGAQDTQQFEAGFKTNWLNDQLLFNVTLFDARTKNILAQVYDPNGTSVEGIYNKAGDLVRKGAEIELTGRITNNLEVLLGYAYLDAGYKESPLYKEGSAPMNSPKHSANGWVNYHFTSGTLKNLSLGAGAYFVGKRPVNEYNLKPDNHGSLVGDKPFDMPDFTTVNANISYVYKAATIRVFANNIFNKTGYTSYYRGGYINEMAPRNFAAQLSYKF